MASWDLEPTRVCRLAIASNLGSILLTHLAVVKRGVEVCSVAVMNCLFSTENSGNKGTF